MACGPFERDGLLPFVHAGASAEERGQQEQCDEAVHERYRVWVEMPERKFAR
jgi:hypothetical protein